MVGVGKPNLRPSRFSFERRFCRYGLEMLRIPALKYSTDIAGIFIFWFAVKTTIYGRAFSSGKVRIKVV
jgi:hypothetical protein